MGSSKITGDADLSSAPDSTGEFPSVPPAEQDLTVHRRVRRLDWNLLADATLGFFSLETTFGRTLRWFLRRPRAAFEGYLGAERLSFSNPLKLLITLTAISTFLNFVAGNFDALVEGVAMSVRESKPGQALTVGQEAALTQFLQRNYNLFVFGGLPVISLATRLVYWKRAYNFVEHLALNSFILSVGTAAYVVLFVPSILFPSVILIYVALSLVYQTWTYRLVMGPGWMRALAAVTLSSGIYFVILAIAVGFYLRFFLPAG